MLWQTSRFDIDLAQPRVMGIVNLTPDSFSDGGQHASVNAALQHAQQLLKDGADVLDIGAESTRPGAAPVPAPQEWQRLQGFLTEAVRWGVPLSIDTYKASTMQRALDAGADIVNDVWALRQPGALAAVAAHPRCGVCLMHMHGQPQTMQAAPMQGPVAEQVQAFLSQRVQALQAAGVQTPRIVLDAGIGFGKTVDQNFELLAQHPLLATLGLPLLAAWSRKSSLGAAIARTGHSPPPPHERVAASVAAALLAAQRGARVLRVHDVRETVDALRVWARVQAHELP